MTPSRLASHLAACVGLFCLVAAAPASAQLPRIRLDAIFPAGGQTGTNVTVTIRGELADAATELVFSHPDIESMQLQDPPSEFRVAHRKANQFDVRIGRHVPPGRYEVRALGPAGLSAPRSFVVSHLVHRSFDSNENSLHQSFPMQVGETIHAQTRAEQRDYFSFSAEQHRPLLIQVLADRVDSKMDAILALYQKDGKRLHKIRQSLSQDPILAFTPPSDGEYVLEIYDATFRGNLPYLVEVSEQPWVEAVFPPFAATGKECTFTVYGYNLPNGTPVSGFERDGQLQSAEVHFTPSGENRSTAGNWLSRQTPSAARLAGSNYRLPDHYSTGPTVFLANSDESTIREEPSSQDNPQQISLPASVTGQFYPKRDRDWFAFEAQKDHPLWIELTTAQLGLPSDPAIRIQRKRIQDGNVTYQSVATADDIEGPPNNRDSRRFYTGTPDVAYRFNPPEDGTYLVSVADQYNSTRDDPRLSYRLTLSPPRPDFELVAFADPERFPDDKIVRPNGVGVLPGGTATVRVRLLNKHGFSGEVTVRAEELPAGVTATPILLNRDTPEGFLVLEASADAASTVSSLQIVGQSTIADQTRVRHARMAAIAWGVNNADQEATQVRTTDDLQIAVLDTKPSPLQIGIPNTTIRTSRGAKTAVKLQLNRREDFREIEVNLSAVQRPNRLKIDAQKSTSDQVELILQATDAELKPGRYSVVFGSKLKDKRPKNAGVLAEARGDLEKIDAALNAVESQLQKNETTANERSAIAAATQQKLDAIRSRASEPRNQLLANLQTQLEITQSLQNLLEQAIADATNEQLQSKIGTAEEQLATVRSQRTQLQQQFGAQLAELNAIQAELAEQQATAKLAEEALAQVREQRERITKEKAAAEKRLSDAEKSQLADAEFWVFAKAITVEVEASPIGMVAKDVTAGPGSQVELPFVIERKHGFEGQVTVQADFPEGSGLSSPSVVLGPGVTNGKLTMDVRENAAPKTHALNLRVQANFNGVPVDDAASRVLIEVKPQE